METDEKKETTIWDRIFLTLIFIFLGPIVWLADKINGSGSGAGPAFASFLIAAALIIGGVILLALAAIVLIVVALV